jgi:hypothetical protein
MVIPPPLSCQDRVQHVNINIRTALMSYRLLVLHPILYIPQTQKPLLPMQGLMYWATIVSHSVEPQSTPPTVKLPCWVVQTSGVYPRVNLNCSFIHWIYSFHLNMPNYWQLIGLHKFNICRTDSSVQPVKRLWAGLLRNWDLVPGRYWRLLWSVQTISGGSFPIC